MALLPCRTKLGPAVVLAGIVCAAGCGLRPALTAAEVGVELPPGAGSELLLDRCLGCHDLGGIALFSGFYTRDRWRELVQTMVAQGAVLNPNEIESLSDYLDRHFGMN